MPNIDWCGKPTDWYKECTQCKISFWVEADDIAEAGQLMFKHFSSATNSKDKLSSECRSCSSNRCSKRRQGTHRDEMLEQQDGKCAIKSCRRNISFKAKTARVDHDHETEKIRMILCPNCNRLMGLVDNEKLLTEYITYRDKFR